MRSFERFLARFNAEIDPILEQTRPDRAYLNPAIQFFYGDRVRQITGGLLVQSRDNGAVTPADLKVVTQRQPSEQELKDCLFAWTVARHVKSNAIVYARDGITAGIGAGQMNRRDSSRIAVQRAREAAESAGWSEPMTTNVG